MAINLSGLSGVWDTLSGIARMNGLGTTVAETRADDGLSNETLLIQNARETAMGLAHATAAAENRQPNLTDYWHAAMLQPELQGNPRMIADLSGMTLDGFVIRAEDLTPNAQTRAVMGDLYDLDANGEINVEAIDNFFREASTHMNFNTVQFHNVTFQPATTLEIFAHTQGAQFANITLDGLGAGETLTIGTSGQPGANRESYSNVRVINDQGGIIRVNGNATVNGLVLENGNTVLDVAPGGRVNGLSVNSETVSLQMQSMGELFLPSFDNANFTPASSMCGAIIRGNPMDAAFHGFRNSNLNGLNFANANISGIDFQSCDVTGAMLDGARLSNVTFSSDMDLTAASMNGLRSAHHVQILDTNGRVVETLNDTSALLAYVARQQEAKEQNNGVFVPVVAEQPNMAALAQPADRTQAVARSLNLSWNGEVSSYQNDNSSDQSQGVRFQQVNTLAGLQGVGGLPVANASAPARVIEGGDIPAAATNAERIVATGAAITPTRLEVVEADASDISKVNISTLNTPEARAARQEIAEARMADLGLLRNV